MFYFFPSLKVPEAGGEGWGNLIAFVLQRPTVPACLEGSSGAPDIPRADNPLSPGQAREEGRQESGLQRTEQSPCIWPTLGT